MLFKFRPHVGRGSIHHIALGPTACVGMAMNGKGGKPPSEMVGRQGRRGEGGVEHIKREARGRSQGPRVGGGRKGKPLFCQVDSGPSCAEASDELVKLREVKATACHCPLTCSLGDHLSGKVPGMTRGRTVQLLPLEELELRDRGRDWR